MFVHFVNVDGSEIVSVTAYPIIPLASSVAFIVIVFVVALVLDNTIGFVLSIPAIVLDI